jgi:hypothetical protein
MATGFGGNPTFFPLTQAQYNGSLALVQAAQNGWAGLVQGFAAENQALGITTTQMQLIQSVLLPVNTYGQDGLLLLAFQTLGTITPTDDMAPFLTDARINYMQNQVIQLIATLQAMEG